MGDERNRVARNATSAYAARVLMGVSALALTPYLYRRLGDGGFGTWSVILTLATIVSMLELGFSAATARFVSDARGRGNRRELEATVAASLALMALLGAAAAGLFVAGAYALQGLAAPAERADFRLGMLVLGVAMLARLPLFAYAAVLQGYQRFEWFYASLAVTTVLFAGGAVVAVELGTGVLGVAVAQAASIVVGALVYVVGIARVDPRLSLLARPTRAAGGRVAAFGGRTLLADGMVFIAQRMDVVVVAAVRDAATAAPYAAALKLQSAVQSLTLPFVNLLMPMVAELWASGRRDAVAARVELATRVALQITLPVAAAIALFAGDLVDLWLGSGAPAEAAAIVAVLMAVQVVTLTAAPAERALVGVGRVVAVSRLALVEGTANILLSIALVVRLGAVGAAFATLATSALLAPLRFPLLAHALGCPTRGLVARSLAPALVASAPAVLAMGACRLLLPEGPGRLLLGAGGGVVLAALAAVAQVGPARAVELLRRAPLGKGRARVFPAAPATTSSGDPHPE